MSRIRVGIVMDEIETIQREKDTTLAFMLEAQSRGWQIAVLTLNDLFLNNGVAEGYVQYIKIENTSRQWYQIEGKEMLQLNAFDVILMRKDPPVDFEYIMATYILEIAEKAGTLVLNNPRSLRDFNEKVLTTSFPQCCPPSLFTRSKLVIKKFLDSNQKIVLKPVNKMGGQSVFIISINDPNTNVIIEEVTKMETCYVQAQVYIPEIETEGDKRILFINGQPVKQGIARMPARGDHRGNLAVGAVAKGFELNENDNWICSQIGPFLKNNGLFFVGIDVIGNYCTEINITSPTGIREIDHIFQTNIAALFFDELEQLIRSR